MEKNPHKFHLTRVWKLRNIRYIISVNNLSDTLTNVVKKPL